MKAVKSNQSKNRPAYVHKTTPIPKRTRHFCHSSSNNVSELQAEVKSIPVYNNKKGSSAVSSTPTVANSTNESSSTHAFDKNKHSPCIFRTQEFNFPLVSTPFSTRLQINIDDTGENNSAKLPDPHSKSLSSTVVKIDSSSLVTSTVSKKCSEAQNVLNRKSKLPVVSRRHFSTLMNSPRAKNSELLTSCSSFKTVLEPTSKFSPFKTPRRQSSNKLVENGHNLTRSNSNVAEPSNKRSYIAYQRHVLRMSKGDRTSLDSSIGNVYKCRFEPTKCTPKKLDEAKNFLNSVQNVNLSPNFESAPMPSSKINSQIDNLAEDSNRNLVTPVISSLPFGGHPTHSLISTPDPIENVRDFFTSIQKEANQSNMPSIREELASKLLLSNDFSQNESKPLSPVGSFSHTKKSKLSSFSSLTENSCDFFESNNSHHKILFDIIQNSLLSFEVALKFVVGLSANFYNCYKDITNAGEDSILAIEDGMINSVKLMNVIPDEVVGKFLNFGKLCSKVINGCEHSDTLSIASLRNIANYFNNEPHDMLQALPNSIITNNFETKPHLYRSNLMSPSRLKQTYTSTPNNKAINDNHSNHRRFNSINKENLHTTSNKRKSSCRKSTNKPNLLSNKSRCDDKKNLMHERAKLKTNKSPSNFNSNKIEVSCHDNASVEAPKYNLNTNPTSNNTSEPGYHYKSPRRLSSRTTSSFFQKLSVMSDNAIANVETDDNQLSIDTAIGINNIDSIECSATDTVGDKSSRKRKVNAGSNSVSLSRSGESDSGSKKSHQLKSSETNAEAVEETHTQANATSVVVESVNGEDASNVNKRRSVRIKTTPKTTSSKPVSTMKTTVRKPRKVKPAKNAGVVAGDKRKKATTAIGKVAKKNSIRQSTKKSPKAESKKKLSKSSTTTKTRPTASTKKPSKKDVTNVTASKKQNPAKKVGAKKVGKTAPH